jgi:putative spermidine/putrescine transport system permease protein
MAPYLFSAPALLTITAFFLLPIVELVIGSFAVRSAGGQLEFSLAIYRGLLSDPYTYALLLRTVRLATTTVAVCFVLAFPIALYIQQLSPRLKTLLTFLLLSPLLTSVVVRTLGWVVLLGPSGLFNQALAGLGLPHLNLLYTESGVVVGLTHVLLGYMVLAVLISMQKIDDNLLLAASNLGAGRAFIIGRIILPLCLPGIVAGSVLVFTMAASSYATPMLLGGSQSKVAATEIYNLAIQYMDWSSAAALALLLFCLTTTVVLLGTWISESGTRKALFQ